MRQALRYAVVPVLLCSGLICLSRAEEISILNVYLFTDVGQELAARHGFRPQSSAVLDMFGDRFKSLQLFSVTEIAGSWAQAQKVHFSDGGIFDQLYKTRR